MVASANVLNPRTLDKSRSYQKSEIIKLVNGQRRPNFLSQFCFVFQRSCNLNGQRSVKIGDRLSDLFCKFYGFCGFAIVL